VLGTIAGLTAQLAMSKLPPHVVPWASPVPFFGEIERSRVATVGINPSNLEFVDGVGAALAGKDRRLETLTSLDLKTWCDADGHTVRALARSCSRYFWRNPYRRWFDVLERVLNVGGLSYYSGNLVAHLDLVAFATTLKWSALPPSVKRTLVLGGRISLADTIASSSVEVLVLNGRSVATAFVESTGTALRPTTLDYLCLPRATGQSVPGIRWDGMITHIAGRDLGREVRVIGFNHNLQSSFGVTSAVMKNIGLEIGSAIA
jgi:hypothetical protein